MCGERITQNRLIDVGSGTGPRHAGACPLGGLHDLPDGEVQDLVIERLQYDSYLLVCDHYDTALCSGASSYVWNSML